MRVARWMIAVAGLCVAAGCRASTKVVDEPRLDIELAGAGNRGYLVGTPPSGRVSKTTRQVLETEIEMPSGGKGKAGRSPAGGSGGGAAAPVKPQASSGSPYLQDVPLDVTVGEPTVATPAGRAAEAKADTYVVQKGDSLWSIAAKPQVFGNGTRWRELYEANRDVLKGPEKLRAGMSLKIPAGGGLDASFSDSGEHSESGQYVK